MAPALSFEIGLIVALAVGLAFRLAVIASPLGEIDGDEAIVGLMARHIAFLGSGRSSTGASPISAAWRRSAAPLFRLLDSSTLLLKLVPTAYSLGFLALSAVVARPVRDRPGARDRRLSGPAAGDVGGLEHQSPGGYAECCSWVRRCCS